MGAGFVYLAVGLIPVLIGLGAAATLGTDVEPEQVLSRYAQTQLPIALYAVFLGALVSAILSTLSGALLVAGSLAAHNLIAPLAGSRLSERTKLRLNRAAVVVFGVIAYLISLGSDSMYRLVEQASGLASAGVLVLMIVAIFVPAVGGVASAAAALIASVVADVNEGYVTPEAALRSALRLLPDDRVQLAGVALSRVDMRKQARFGYGDDAFYHSYKRYYA